PAPRCRRAGHVVPAARGRRRRAAAPTRARRLTDRRATIHRATISRTTALRHRPDHPPPRLPARLGTGRADPPGAVLSRYFPPGGRRLEPWPDRPEGRTRV